MIKRTKIGKFNLSFVLRHYWEKDQTDRRLYRLTNFRTKEFGIFFRKDRSIGTKASGRDMLSKENLVSSYRIGLNLGWIKAWINFDFGVKYFKI
jgi:hypothetical protein